MAWFAWKRFFDNVNKRDNAMQEGKVLKGLDKLKESREKNDQNLKQLQDIFYQQIDKALVNTPTTTFADIMAALDMQCQERIKFNQNDEFARVMQMTINVMQHYYARLHPDHAPAEWLERE